MSKYIHWQYPDFPEKVNQVLLQNDNKLIIVGVIGKSAFPDCNKMLVLDVLERHPSLMEHKPKEGQIQFYYNPNESILWLHFETTYDAHCMQKILVEEMQQQTFNQFLTFHQRMRSRFARMFLFATHICHIIVFVELNVTFDASLLTLFKALKIIRDRYVLKFLPKFIKNSPTGLILGRCARLCSPRVIFVFENLPKGFEKTHDMISKLEFEIEDNIYKMLRNECILVNNNASSLFSIPVNQRFVYYNIKDDLREDPILQSNKLLKELLEKPNCLNNSNELDDLLPYNDFGKLLSDVKNSQEAGGGRDKFVDSRKFMDLLKEHIDEALDTGFNDNLSKFKGKNHFVVLSGKTWLDTFKLLHKIFIENPDNLQFEANDNDYKAYLENFDKILNYEKEFFKACCDNGLQKAYSMYNAPTLTYYNGTIHQKMVQEAISLYRKYARGPNTSINESKLRAMCEACWKSGKQQCEYPSLRGNLCVLPKHKVKTPNEHSTGIVLISACNCGRTQGRREDPYSIRYANYEFYEYMAKNCNLCTKVKRIRFAIFEPSIQNYRAVAYEHNSPNGNNCNSIDKNDNACTSPMTKIENEEELHNYYDSNISQIFKASQDSHANLSLSTTNENCNKLINYDDDDGCNKVNSSDDSLNELVLKVKGKEEQNDEKERLIARPSTTEYLAGMMHTFSPLGLLPQFPSWSLCCVGPSSIYSHNTGLMEHFQSGFWPHSNFLLPWDVHVRLEHSASWVAAYDRSRYRKMGEVFILKIFVGFEYECPRGHRFMMSTPDKILRAGSGILRDSGTKVVYNNMPLYFPCPCRTKNFYVAQLMRVHVVTPKAPVNVSLDPKVRTGEPDYIFNLGLPEPPKLSQSAYWILRLPYIYQGDKTPITPPTEITASNAMNYGCILAGMFGVSEVEIDD